jgi:hypothetical protein
MMWPDRRQGQYWMEIDRIWQLALKLTIVELTCFGALLLGVFIAALFAIYMYGGLLLEELQTRRVRSVRRQAWIDGHTARERQF